MIEGDIFEGLIRSNVDHNLENSRSTSFRQEEHARTLLRKKKGINAKTVLQIFTKL